MNFWSPWIEVTIAGFVYVSAIFLIILCFLNIHKLTFLKCLQPYTPYIAFVVLFSSYVCGFVAHMLSSKLFALWSLDCKYFRPEKIIDINKRVPDYLRNSIALSYNNLILLRHLSFATLCLSVALFYWLDPKQFPKQRIVLPIACIIFAVIFASTYFAYKPEFVQLTEMMNAYMP
jgi:hypothetical protein